MRKFVAACCCAIVGLEVLIAVPLITCLVVLGLVGGIEDVQQVAMDVPVGTQQYASAPFIPPPPLSPTGFSGPPIGPPPISYSPPCTSQPPCPVSENVAAVAPPQLSPQVEAIAEVHERIGSPLADSSLAADPAATRADTIAALEHVAGQDSAPTLPPPEAPSQAESSISSLKPAPLVAGTGECPKACPSECPAKPSLVESLRAAADQLYVKAQELEIDGNFSRADQLRTLARGIRTEIDTHHRESNPQAPAPSTVTAASFNPQWVEPEQVEAKGPVQPAVVQLVEPAAFPTRDETAQDIAEVEKLPQIPAP
jgi:hypothetical protein